MGRVKGVSPLKSVLASAISPEPSSPSLFIVLTNLLLGKPLVSLCCFWTHDESIAFIRSFHSSVLHLGEALPQRGTPHIPPR